MSFVILREFSLNDLGRSYALQYPRIHFFIASEARNPLLLSPKDLKKKKKHGFNLLNMPITQNHVYSTVQYSTVHYITLHYSTAQYSTLQYSTVQYNTVQYSTVRYSTVQYSTCTVQYGIKRFLI